MLLPGQLVGYTKHQHVATSKHLQLTMPLVVWLISPLFAKSKKLLVVYSYLPYFSMSALHKPSQKNSKNQEATAARHLPIISQTLNLVVV